MEENKQPSSQKIQIYPTSTGEISPFWRDKYEKDAKKYWDIFYKRHQDKVTFLFYLINPLIWVLFL